MRPPPVIRQRGLTRTGAANALRSALPAEESASPSEHGGPVRRKRSSLDNVPPRCRSLRSRLSGKADSGSAGSWSGASAQD